MDYFLIGMPLGHSHSPYVHSFFGYEYGLKPIEQKDLESFYCERKFKGINVTIPYKLASLPYLDEIDETVKECGAVNTVVNSNGKLKGYNTDIYGMDYAIKAAGIDLTDKKVLILGTGGTSNTAQALCRRYSCSYTVVGRKNPVNYNNVYEKTDTEIIINTTPVGMYPNIGAAALDVTRFPNLQGVFDAIYNPIKTRLVLEAEALKIKCAGGINMLVGQAKRGAELFTGKSFDNGIIKLVSENILKKLTDIVLIGMPGSGKTTIGKLLAEKLNREFYDSDEEIVKRENRSIPQIFATDGEAYFRKVEKEVIADLTKKQGVILATGGGAVLDRDNRLNMRQNGFCVRLVRNIEDLPTDGRPLSANADAIKKLSTEREPYYNEVADITVDNRNIEESVDLILNKIK